MTSNELLYSLTLTRIPGLGATTIRKLLQQAGSASFLFEHREELTELFPFVTKRIAGMLDCPDILRRCEAELAFAEKNRIRCLTLDNPAYPSRLRECEDAPSVLFYKGNADLNKLHIVSMVGTRNATEYGKEVCIRFIKELKELMPDTLVVSGLAYGIDIHAHRAALQNGLETIGVLAHGLDRIYPAPHRRTAIEMTEQGGLLTEFPSGTMPDRFNFVRRNRIVAGMSDATIVVESAEKGGALITAEIACTYNRDCFAVPGRVDAPFSAGCNNLIRSNRATLLQNAAELIESMNWHIHAQNAPQPVQRQLFVELTPEEQLLTGLLAKEERGMQINELVVASNIPINRMTNILFELEMKGTIRALAGGVYKLLS